MSDETKNPENGVEDEEPVHTKRSLGVPVVEVEKNEEHFSSIVETTKRLFDHLLHRPAHIRGIDLVDENELPIPIEPNIAPQDRITPPNGIPPYRRR